MVKDKYEVNLVAYTKGWVGQTQNEMQIYIEVQEHGDKAAIELAIATVKAMMQPEVLVECNGILKYVG